MTDGAGDQSLARRPVVATPARNEAQRLPTLLQALAAQSWCAGGDRLPVVLVLNNCTDGSARVVADLCPQLPELALHVIEVELTGGDAHVGTARKMAMDRALEVFPDASVALLTTDADATPEPNWVEANLNALERGADLVGGRIIGDPDEEARFGPGFRRRVDLHLRYAELADRLADLLDPLPHDPMPRHSDHTGASLAVSGEVYRAVGGLPPLPFREDVAFVRRVRAAGYRLRHCPKVRVGVSARLRGRAPGGMADCLKSWIRAEAHGEPHRVEPVALLAARLSLRRGLRAGQDAHGLPLPDDLDLLGLPANGPWTPEAKVELLAGDALDPVCETSVEVAIAQLERLLEHSGIHADAA